LKLLRKFLRRFKHFLNPRPLNQYFSIEYRILRTIKQYQPITLSEIVRKTGLAKSTVYDRLKEMLRKGRIIVERKRYRLKEDFAIGIESDFLAWFFLALFSFLLATRQIFFLILAIYFLIQAIRYYRLLKT